MRSPSPVFSNAAAETRASTSCWAAQAATDIAPSE